MIDLMTLSRIRLKSGTRVHAVTPPGSGRTACGKYVRTFDTWGRRQDTALAPESPITCQQCKRQGAAL